MNQDRVVTGKMMLKQYTRSFRFAKRICGIDHSHTHYLFDTKDNF